MISLAEMKRVLCFLFFLNVFLIASAQNTWVQKLSYYYTGPWSHTDSLNGIRYLDIGPDGDIYVIANFGLSTLSRLYKISDTGSPVKWMITVGFHAGITASYTNSVHATSDSGCVITFNYWGSQGNIVGYIQKYDKAGELSWEHEFPNNFPVYNNETFDAIQNSAGNYYALVGDTLDELDFAGNIIRYDSTVGGKKIIELQNGNLIIQTKTDSVVCRTFGGPNLWSIPLAKLLTCNSSYAFLNTANGIQKVDLVNGSISWTKNYPWAISDADTTNDGGFTACVGTIPGNIYSNCSSCHGPGIVFKVDSLGDTLWSKSYNLPYYGFGKIKRSNTGNLITGGSFKFIISYYNNNRDFSCFLTSLDSTGNGVIASEEYIWPGDDNKNQMVSITDDALYTVLEFGKSGPPRDTINFLYNQNLCCISDYAIDWPDTNVLGVNLKYTDFNGDGTIDTNDIIKYVDPFLIYPFPLPNLKIVNPENTTQNIATLEIFPETDTINPGDTVNFFIRAGNLSVPIDTICGIAFTGLWPWFSHVSKVSTTDLSSDLGTIGTDLYSFNKTLNNGNLSNYFLNCRTNGQDAYNVYDTLGIFSVVIDSLSQPDSVFFSVYSSNAIKCNGETIPINFVSTPAYVYQNTIKVYETQNSLIQVYPNPSSETISINGLKNKTRTEIDVYDATGNLMLSQSSSEKNLQISTQYLANGIYYLRIQSHSGIFHKSFAVQH